MKQIYFPRRSKTMQLIKGKYSKKTRNISCTSNRVIRSAKKAQMYLNLKQIIATLFHFEKAESSIRCKKEHLFLVKLEILKQLTDKN